MPTNWNAVNNALSQAVLDRDLLKDLLEQLGCDEVRAGRGDMTYRSTCPIHGGDGPNLQVKGDGESVPIRWACFSHQCQEKWKPSLLGLVRGVLSAQQSQPVSLPAAVDFVKDILGGMPTVKPSAKRQRAKPLPTLLNLSRERARGQLTIPSPYFVSRGYAPAILDGLDVGHSARLRRTVIPFHDDRGEKCIGYLSRSEQPECGRCRGCHRPGQGCQGRELKWDILDGFPKSSFLYNYHTARQSDSPLVLVVEGPADVWRAAEAGFLALALLGTDISAEQCRKVKALRKFVFPALDNDKAGRDGMHRVEDRLRAVMSGVNPLFVPQPYKDIGDMPSEKVVQWLSGCITLSPHARPPHAC
jgi:hypothetical protein